MRFLLAGCLALGLAVAVPLASVRAQQIESREGIALRDQILGLRQEVQTLRDQIARGGGTPAGGSSLGGYQQPAPLAAPPAAEITTQLLDRVQRLEDEFRTLRGRVDESNNAHQRAEEDLAKQIGDLNFKVDGGAAGSAGAAVGGSVAGGAASPVAGGAPPVSGPRPTAPVPLSPPPGNLSAGSGDFGAAPSDGLPVPPPPPPPKRTAELILQEGNTALARHDYAAAEGAAREVLASPKGPRSADAQFLLAQSLAGRKDFSGAAVAFDDTYNRNRTGGHAQDSLLGLASSLTAINERRAACETLDKLRAEFPSPRADLRESVAAARKAANCR